MPYPCRPLLATGWGRSSPPVILSSLRERTGSCNRQAGVPHLPCTRPRSIAAGLGTCGSFLRPRRLAPQINSEPLPASAHDVPSSQSVTIRAHPWLLFLFQFDNPAIRRFLCGDPSPFETSETSDTSETGVHHLSRGRRSHISPSYLIPKEI